MDARPAGSSFPATMIQTQTATSNAAVIDRLIKMRRACYALSVELAGARRQLRAVEAELERIKRRPSAV